MSVAIVPPWPYGPVAVIPRSGGVLNAPTSTAGLKAPDDRTVGMSEPWMGELADGHIAELTNFMEVLAAARSRCPRR